MGRETNLENDLIFIGRAALAAVLAFIVGWEREARGSPAGDRTFAGTLPLRGASAADVTFAPQCLLANGAWLQAEPIAIAPR